MSTNKPGPSTAGDKNSQTQSKLPLPSKLPVPRSGTRCSCSKTGISAIPVSNKPPIKSSTSRIPQSIEKTITSKKVEETNAKKKTTTKITRTYSGGAKSTTQPTPAGKRTAAVKKIKGPKSSLEKVVQDQLILNASRNPGGPARAMSGKQTKAAAPPIIETPDGPVKGTLQISLEQSVDRSANVDYIKKHITGVEVNEDDGTTNKYEYNIQETDPGGLNASGMIEDRALPLHEVISCKNTLSFAPGIKQTITTTVYESTQPDTVELLEMIEEETKEIQKISSVSPPDIKGSFANVYALKKKLQKMQLNPESVKRLELSINRFPISADEPQEELPSGIVAALMHTEERGLPMDSDPSDVYNYLFHNIQDDITIKVNPVAPKPLQNVMVPEAVPPELLASGVTRQIKNMIYELNDCVCEQPTADIFTNSILKAGEGPKIYNVATKGSAGRPGYPMLSAEEPPWNIDELQPIADLVGAVPVHTMTTVDISDPSVEFYRNDVENVLEYQLVPKPPRYVSNVQLRGSQKPSWFPGYYVALPDSIKVVSSPGDVLPAAWQAVQPDIFSEDSFLIVG